MKIKKITGTAVLSALTIVLTLVSNYIQIGTVSINLATIPIAIAAMVYGMLPGIIVGLVNGLVVLLAPSTMSFFFPISPIGTVLICLLKTSIAGLICGLVYRLFKTHKLVGSVVSSLLTVLINTGLFIVGSLIFFMPIYGDFTHVIISVITINFLIEIAITGILSPATIRVMSIANKRFID